MSNEIDFKTMAVKIPPEVAEITHPERCVICNKPCSAANLVPAALFNKPGGFAAICDACADAMETR